MRWIISAFAHAHAGGRARLCGREPSVCFGLRTRAGIYARSGPAVVWPEFWRSYGLFPAFAALLWLRIYRCSVEALIACPPATVLRCMRTADYLASLFGVL